MPVPAPGADAAVAGGEDDAGQPGQGTAEHERADHPAADVQAVEHGGVGVGADRVELAATARGVQVVADRDHDQHRDDEQHRDATGSSWCPASPKESGRSEALIRSLPAQLSTTPR